MQLTIDFNQTEKINTWKSLISEMTNDQIGYRSLLVSMSEPTEDNKLFQKLLTEEYNKRK